MWMVLSCVIWRLVRRLESNLGQRVSRVAIAALHIANLRSRSHHAALSGPIEHEIARARTYLLIHWTFQRPEVRILGEPKWLQARHAEAWHKMATQKFKHDQHYRAFFSCLSQLSAGTKPLASPSGAVVLCESDLFDMESESWRRGCHMSRAALLLVVVGGMTASLHIKCTCMANLCYSVMSIRFP